MKKLKLNLEKLSVESFETNNFKTEKGTLKGFIQHEQLPPSENHGTCEDTVCYNTCEFPCHV